MFCFLVIGLAARAEAARLRLSVPVHGVSHVAFYAAKEKGYFQEEGLDVEVILMSGAIGIRALIAGDVDASTVGGSALPPFNTVCRASQRSRRPRRPSAQWKRCAKKK